MGTPEQPNPIEVGMEMSAEEVPQGIYVFKVIGGDGTELINGGATVSMMDGVIIIGQEKIRASVYDPVKNGINIDVPPHLLLFETRVVITRILS